METALDRYKKTNFKSLDKNDQKEVSSVLIQMYKSGKTIEEIANDLNKSSATIHRILQKINYNPRPPSPKPAKINISDIEEMYKTGLTMSQIAFHFSVSTSFISKILKVTRLEDVLAKDESINLTETYFICPYCWSISGACCGNDSYLELPGYTYKSFLDADDKTKRRIIESEQSKIHKKQLEQSNIIRQLGRY